MINFKKRRLDIAEKAIPDCGQIRVLRIVHFIFLPYKDATNYYNI
ncbi:hypothetical protein UUU_00680 [Klebsiella pneumoniae subsp. pneumoniae DSM 30104 = JCM 1662 = NBRC 14940]|nr:hypothetical protein KPNIH7_16958 [Klebsiella pneumoniae subsp. pneumoniae KPNIH7]EJJ68046.1 hypothetical protein KPNIH9_18870 [Klebsiella pneumoniae subsp. pneumoniae KPNIH9]EJK92770.1 hypothetical protein UUU_00680 [Klebsiella pneumoniae subsp. pneumoniae DSM 30104 = JCM 1662 = NBRC 14940]